MEEIIKLAEEAKNQLAFEFKNHPKLELWNWLNLGLRREALVSELYKKDYIKRSIAQIRL